MLKLQELIMLNYELCKSVQKDFLNKGKKTSAKGLKHEDRKKLSEIKSETIKPHDIFQLMDLSRQLSVLRKSEVIDKLERLGVKIFKATY